MKRAILKPAKLIIALVMLATLLPTGFVMATDYGDIMFRVTNAGELTVDNSHELLVNFVISGVEPTQFTQEPSWTISRTIMVFPSAQPGYGTRPPMAVAINNTGTSALSGVSAVITTGSGYFEFVATPTASVAAGTQTMASVRPKTGHATGTYTGVLTITAGDGTAATSQTVSLSFTVGAATVSNPHSSWAEERLIKSFEMDLVPTAFLDTTVDLTKPITRAEFAAVGVKVYEALSGDKVLPAAINPFTDTNDVEVLKAYSIGIVSGTSATTYTPDRVLNREEAAHLLTNVFKKVTMPGWTSATNAQFPLVFDKPEPFSDDAAISAWAKDSVYFMVANGVITGQPGYIFAPKNETPQHEADGYANATREAALLIAVGMVEKLK